MLKGASGDTERKRETTAIPEMESLLETKLDLIAKRAEVGEHCPCFPPGLRDVRIAEEPYLGKPNVRFREEALTVLSTEDALYST